MMSSGRHSDDAWMSTRCSEFSDEDLPGTAKPMTLFLAVEHLSGWGHDIMDDDVLGELAAPLARVLKDNCASMQFIRKPGRAGQYRDERKLYIARTDHGTCYTTRISGIEDLLSLDIPALADGTWGTCTLPPRDVVRVDHPIMLVCTHGKRDRCCAIKGRPLAAGMQSCFFGDEVWETSHAKGHRFAPTMILLPWGYSYGRLSTAQAVDAVTVSAQGKMYLTGLRGRGCWDAPGQAAEIAVAQALGAHTVPVGSLVVTETTADEHDAVAHQGVPEPASPSTLSRATDRSGLFPTDERWAVSTEEKELASAELTTSELTTTWRTVTTPRGDKWAVQLAHVPAGKVMASCGTPPKDGKTWMAWRTIQVYP